MIVVTPPESEFAQKLDKNEKCLLPWPNESRMSESLPWDSRKQTIFACPRSLHRKPRLRDRKAGSW